MQETEKELQTWAGADGVPSETGCICLSNTEAWDLMPMQRQKAGIKTRSSPAQIDGKETTSVSPGLRVEQKCLLRIQNFRPAFPEDPKFCYTICIV